jgi:hypothetical protein
MTPILALLLAAGELGQAATHMVAQARPPAADATPLINVLDGVRNLLLLFGVPYAGLQGARAAYQIMSSAGEMQDQIKARKSLEHVGWGLVVLFGVAIVLTLIANEFRKAGLTPPGM